MIQELLVMGVVGAAAIAYAAEVLPLVVAVAVMVGVTAMWWRH